MRYFTRKLEFVSYITSPIVETLPPGLHQEPREFEKTLMRDDSIKLLETKPLSYIFSAKLIKTSRWWDQSRETLHLYIWRIYKNSDLVFSLLLLKCYYFRVKMGVSLINATWKKLKNLTFVHLQESRGQHLTLAAKGATRNFSVLHEIVRENVCRLLSITSGQ